MFEYIRLLKLDPRYYWRDLLGLLISGFLTNYLIYSSLIYLRNRNLLSIGGDYFPLKLEAVLIIIWLIAYLFLRKWLLLKVRPLFRKLSGERLFENKFLFDKSKLEEKWEFQGNPDIVDEGLQITNTPSGCLIKNDYWDTKVWDNFSSTFTVDFIKNLGIEDGLFVHQKGAKKNRKYEIREKEIDFRKVLGVIFRSQRFDDYFMVGIWKVENNLIFRPHVRVAGDLDIPYLNPPTNTYPIEHRARVLDFKMLVKANKVIMGIKQRGKWKRCFRWYLPSFYKANLNESSKNNDMSEFVTRKIAFKNLPGQFGFRNYGDELAIIKSLSVNSNFTEEDKDLFSQ